MTLPLETGGAMDKFRKDFIEPTSSPVSPERTKTSLFLQEQLPCLTNAKVTKELETESEQNSSVL